jgi:hypothetical protein
MRFEERQTHIIVTLTVPIWPLENPCSDLKTKGIDLPNPKSATSLVVLGPNENIYPIMQ